MSLPPEIQTDELVPEAEAPRDIVTPDTYDEDQHGPIRCAICGTPEEQARSLPARYSNPVCKDCDELAVDSDGNEPWTGFRPGEKPDSEPGVIHMAPDQGENPVFIAGVKCWRRYRFGGWVTRRDAFDCSSIEEFHDYHRPHGKALHAFNTPHPDGIDVTQDDLDALTADLGVLTDLLTRIHEADDQPSLSELHAAAADRDEGTDRVAAILDRVASERETGDHDPDDAVRYALSDEVRGLQQQQEFCERYLSDE